MAKYLCTLRSLAAALSLMLLAIPAVHAADEGREKALKVIGGMSDFLGKTKQFGVTIEIAYDVVQDWGQKIEFGETRTLTVRRPDRIRIETTDRNGAVSGLVFDGQQIAAFDTNENVYATAEKPGSLDGAIAYFVGDLGMRLPMAGVLSERLPEIVKDWADDVAYVDEVTIAGTRCDHIALRGEWEDVQMWIAQGDQPLLQRMVITYKRAEGQPEFAAQLTKWDLSAAAPDAAFAFTPPTGAAKIAFMPQRDEAPHAGVVELKGGKP
jgi:hypothetical protein